MDRDQIDALVSGLRDPLTDRERVTIEVAKRIAVLDGVLRRAVQPELAEQGLTYADFEVLAALRRAGKPYRARPSRLAKDLLLTSGGTTNVLHRLEQRGLVEREPNPDDARSRHVRLTRQGLRLADRVVRNATAAQTAALKDVPESALRDAANALRPLLLHLP